GQRYLSQEWLSTWETLNHIVHFYRNLCLLSHWTNIVAWQQMPTFCGIAANLQETLVGFLFCFECREVMNYSFQ
uniref:Uncharacterized protein n=1 Tax=Microcebus murinus TaxID=30608 RepID=A0A8C5YI81_MICMU